MIVSVSDGWWKRNGREGKRALGNKGAFALCVVFVLVGLALAFSFFSNPTQCDNKPMRYDDRCSSTGSVWSKRYRERLVTPLPPLPDDRYLPHDIPIHYDLPTPTGRTMNEQRGVNRKQGYIALLCTGFVAVVGTVGLLRERDGRRADLPDPDDADPPRDG